MKKLGSGAITTGSGTLLYTVPTGYKADVNQIDIANTTANAISCAIYLVPVGGSATTSNILFPTVSVPANTLIQWTGVQHLNTGDFIQGVGGAAGITVHISGEETR